MKAAEGKLRALLLYTAASKIVLVTRRRDVSGVQ
jgi:hypothetical protein